jgi:NADPH-dependent 2,4-dienoyl-CoA reductase/sulfur reductase-like enzyme/rhodanese-related sulfurtransferase
MKRVIIVGGETAGMTTAKTLRRLSEDLEVIVYEKSGEVSLGRCGLAYVLGGEVKEKGRLLGDTPDTFRREDNIDVHTGIEVLDINRSMRQLHLRNLRDNTDFYDHYDALVLATGASPTVPNIPGIRRPGHFTLHSYADLESVQRWMNEQKVRQVVVMGGGYIGLEIIEQLSKLSLNVILVESECQVMGSVDTEMAALVHKMLIQKDVEVVLGNQIVAFVDANPGEQARASVVVLQDGSRVSADMVLFSVGVTPNVSLARSSALIVGEKGGIVVDSTLRTSDANIWALGDVIEFGDPLAGTRKLTVLAGPAHRQAGIVAHNILSGGAQEHYAGSLSTAVTRVFDLVVGVTGLNEEAVHSVGIDTFSVIVHSQTHCAYYPNVNPISVKGIFARQTGEILGAQVVGFEGVDKRTDVLATAITARMTAEQIANLDLGYAPQFGSPKDVIHVVGTLADNVFSRSLRQVYWQELEPLIAQDKVRFLEIINPQEPVEPLFPGCLSYSQSELRSRLTSLPGDKELIVCDQTGARSYDAYYMLKNHGFRVRYLSGGLYTWMVVNKYLKERQPQAFAPTQSSSSSLMGHPSGKD